MKENDELLSKKEKKKEARERKMMVKRQFQVYTLIFIFIYI